MSLNVCQTSPINVVIRVFKSDPYNIDLQTDPDLIFAQVMDKKTDQCVGVLSYALKNLLSAPDMEVDRFFTLKQSQANSEISVRFALRVSFNFNTISFAIKVFT